TRLPLGSRPRPPAMSSTLCADEYRRLLKVLEACERAGSLESFLSVTLDALDEHMGYHGSAFMLALGQAGHPGTRAYAGAQHGFPEYVLEEYFERWADKDPLASGSGRRCYAAHATSPIEELYGSVPP